MRDWRDVKEVIEAEIDKIWFDEPAEITLGKKGIFPSGAGTDGQAFGNLFFMLSDVEGIGWLLIEYPFYETLFDEEMTLGCFKRLFYNMYHDEVIVLGGNLGKDSKCPAAWLNLHKICDFFFMIVDAYDSIQTKEDMYNLLWSYYKYINRIGFWMYTVFPWDYYGKVFPAINGDAIPEDMMLLAKECGIVKE